MFINISFKTVLLASMLALSACGGGGGGGGGATPPSVTTYTISGTVSGFAGSGLVLQNNGGDDLGIGADGSFSFATQVADGGSYLVSVLTQPSAPVQNCVVSNGTGTVGGSDVTDVVVLCSNYWTWISGSNLGSQTGVYGLMGSADPANVPGSRYGAASLTDSSDGLWMFGGYGYDSAGSPGYLNDLWKFNGTDWIWVSGGDVVNLAGVYGTQGTAAPANIPGGRYEGVSWIDSSDNLWLFGGAVFTGRLNDLWKFDGTNWTWVSGSNASNQSGVYGTQGTAAPTNVPGGRYFGTSWIDSSNILWLFGGIGYDSAGTADTLNDLWKFDGTNWTWVSGGNVVNQAGVYGTQGTAASTNVPGARAKPTSWIDSSNTLWLFGGYGYDSAGNLGILNDLWKFNGTNWTWVSGSTVRNQVGDYGIQGTAASTNVPGARTMPVSWIDSSNTLWLFGGGGYDSAGNSGHLNDLWKFDGTNWIWVSGSDVVNQAGIYGAQGTVDASNLPGARKTAMTWTDSGDTLWLFGGDGYDSTGTLGILGDLWHYTP